MPAASSRAARSSRCWKRRAIHTRAACWTRCRAPRSPARLHQINGMAPSLSGRPSGCAFRPPQRGHALHRVSPHRHHRRPAQLPLLRADRPRGRASMNQADTPVIELKNVHKRFEQRPDLAQRILALAGRPIDRRTVYAVNGVDLSIRRGEVVGMWANRAAASPRWAAWWPACIARPRASCCTRAAMRPPARRRQAGLHAGRADDLPGSAGLAESAPAAAPDPGRGAEGA